MGEGLRDLANVLVSAAMTMPPCKAVDFVHSTLEKFEYQMIGEIGAEAKAVVEGLRALSTSMSNIIRTRGPLIPVLMELVALEDACRTENVDRGITEALAKLDAARELSRGEPAEVR